MDSRNPLGRHDYAGSDVKTPRIEALINPTSPSLSGSSPRFPDYPQASSLGFPSPFPTFGQSPPDSSMQGMPITLPPIDTLNRGMGASGGMGILAEASAMARPAERLPGQSHGKKAAEKDKEKEKEKDPPAWAEMKTKAGKDRKRLPLACIACRRKKIRCSGEKPACKHCLRSRIPCVYKVTTRKAAPRTDYMAMLDKRLKRMEERVIKLIPKENQSAVPRAVVRPALPNPPPKAAGKKRVADEAFAGDPDLDKWAKSRNKGSDLAATLKSTESEDKSLLSEGAEFLPSKEIQEHLAEVYFDYVYGQSYPLLHKPSFLARLAAGDVAPVLVLAVCAISARFSDHPQLRTEPAFLRGEDWAKAAREIALRRWDMPNLTVLIVYLILGLHEFGTCHGGRSWMLAGMAQRMAFALLLHQDLDHNGWGKHAKKNEKSEISPTDREIRRRAMWSCFLMDRFNASGTDRPMQMSEDFVNIPLPVKEQFFRMELSAPTENLNGTVLKPAREGAGQLTDVRENMGVSAYHIKLIAIWGRLVQYLNLGGREKDEHPIWSDKSGLAELKQRLEDIYQNLPSELVWNNDNLQTHTTLGSDNGFVFLHLVYHQIRLFMHRWALPSSGMNHLDKDMPRPFLLESAKTAIDAANNVSLLIKEACDHNVAAPFAGYSAFYSSTVHVVGVFSKDRKTQETAKQNLAHNVKFLTKIKKYWGMFHFVVENLKELFRQHADAARGAGAKGKSDGILQYGDWFDRYPSGVSETDYEDPASKQADATKDTVLGQKSDLQSVEEFFATLSPISRAAQLRKQARKMKQAKKAAEQAEAQKQGDAAKDSSNNVGSSQDIPISPVDQMIDPMTGLPMYGINGTGLEGAQQYNLYNNHNPLIQAPVLSQLSQLDRHIVMSSYTGMDPTSASSIANTMGSQQGSGAPGQPDFTPDMLNGIDMSNWPEWGSSGFAIPSTEASTAWFMPFNLDPPNFSPEGAFQNSADGGMYDFGQHDLGLGGGMLMNTEVGETAGAQQPQ